MSSDAPYLSVVTASRNDDHGGDPLRRTQLFVDSFLEQCQENKLTAELVLVDWNPPKERPGLHEALRWEKANPHCPVHVIQVPPEIHARLRYSNKLPFYQMIAKNVGIRHARGQFVLATNMDILFSRELMAYLARQELDPNRFYRVNRYDVENAVPAGRPWQDQLDYCWNHVIRVNGCDETLSGEDLATALARQKRGSQPRPTTEPAAPLEAIHTNACGDFALLAREQWTRLHGYPEFEAYSFHIDSIFCYMAHYGGVLQQCLAPPCVAFHIEHARGSGFTPEGADKLFNRLDGAGVPRLHDDQLRALGNQMRQERTALIFNDETWGLGRYPLDPGCRSPNRIRHSVARPLPDQNQPGQVLWISSVRPGYDFESLLLALLRKENQQLKAELRLFVDPVPLSGKGFSAWWQRGKGRWKRSFFKRIARL
jgi:hypothetical protein